MRTEGGAGTVFAIALAAALLVWPAVWTAATRTPPAKAGS